MQILSDYLSETGLVSPFPCCNEAEQPMAVLDKDPILRFADDSFFDRFDIPAKNSLDKKFTQLLKGRWDIMALKERLDQLFAGKQTCAC